MVGCKNEPEAESSSPKTRLFEASATVEIIKPNGSVLKAHMIEDGRFDSIEINYDLNTTIILVSKNKNKQKAIRDVEKAIKFCEGWGENIAHKQYDPATQGLYNTIISCSEVQVK